MLLPFVPPECERTIFALCVSAVVAVIPLPVTHEIVLLQRNPILHRVIYKTRNLVHEFRFIFVGAHSSSQHEEKRNHFEASQKKYHTTTPLLRGCRHDLTPLLLLLLHISHPCTCESLHRLFVYFLASSQPAIL